jgi:hypothetical protein
MACTFSGVDPIGLNLRLWTFWLNQELVDGSNFNPKTQTPNNSIYHRVFLLVV